MFINNDNKLEKTNNKKEINNNENQQNNDFYDDYNDYVDENEESNNIFYQNEETNYTTSNTNYRKTFMIIIGILLLIGIIWFIISLFTNNQNDNAIIKTNLTSLGIVKGNEYQIITLSNDSNPPKYAVDNSKLVELNELTGYIKALKEGQTTIKILNDKNETIENIEVYISNTKIDLIDFQIPNTLEIKQGDKAIIHLTISPTNDTNLNFTYQVINTNIIDVNNGIIEALNKGTTDIIVTSGNISRTITVTVK